MSDIKKDRDIGAGTGVAAGVVAGTGVVTGATIGSVAGPIGTVVGAVTVGAVAAKAGDATANTAKPSEYDNYFQANFRNQPYYSSGRDWSDYQPAYQYGFDTYGQYRGQRFEDVEAQLERDWESSRARSRLAWAEARDAVRDGWHRIERILPGDADRDTR